MYSIYDCNMIKSGVRSEVNLAEDYKVLVVDYGQLTENNLEKFLDADIKIMILGAKEWELDASEKVLNELSIYEDIIYLFNYVDGVLFREVVHCMNKKSCYRIPYVVNPYKADCGEGTTELVQDIISNCEVLKKDSKAARYLHKLIGVIYSHTKKRG